MMSLFKSVLIFSLVIGYTQASAQNKIIVKIPSSDEETDYIWSTLQDLKMLESFNYEISLPKGALIEKLKTKSRNGKLNEDDYVQLSHFMEDSVYNKAHYESGFNRIIQQLPLLNALIRRIERTNYPWQFRNFKIYTVKLTLYGSGGSYNPEDSSIVMFTTKIGSFKQYENPANTIIHEIVHLGIEQSIIQKYKVEHALKERIVDFFVLLNFNDVLPGYKMQQMGENRLDPYLTQVGDLMYLDKILIEIMNKD